jgi:hypothetical protein
MANEKRLVALVREMIQELHNEGLTQDDTLEFLVMIEEWLHKKVRQVTAVDRRFGFRVIDGGKNEKA